MTPMPVLAALLSLATACVVPASTGSGAPRPKEPEQVRPEWHIRAEANQQAGEAAYLERLATAPRRAPTEEITIFFQVDAMDFFRKSYAHHNVSRDFKAAFEDYRQANPHPTLQFPNFGGGVHEEPDWWQSMLAMHQRVDVYALFTVRAASRDEASAACAGVPRPMLYVLSARWSSAYRRNDHATEEVRYCRAGYPDDLRESVPQMRALFERVMADIDTTVRGELPSLAEQVALTPPYRATWTWKITKGGGGLWFGYF